MPAQSAASPSLESRARPFAQAGRGDTVAENRGGERWGKAPVHAVKHSRGAQFYHLFHNQPHSLSAYNYVR